MSKFRHTAMHNARHVIYQTHPPNMEVFSSAKFLPSTTPASIYKLQKDVHPSVSNFRASLEGMTILQHKHKIKVYYPTVNTSATNVSCLIELQYVQLLQKLHFVL